MKNLFILSNKINRLANFLLQVSRRIIHSVRLDHSPWSLGESCGGMTHIGSDVA
jgi:hypothetical protein